jgi:hypothetical protein
MPVDCTTHESPCVFPTVGKSPTVATAPKTARPCPCGPVGPDGPDGPVAPFAPFDPVGPVGPVGPFAGPVGPSGPIGPVGPAIPRSITTLIDGADCNIKVCALNLSPRQTGLKTTRK